MTGQLGQESVTSERYTSTSLTYKVAKQYVKDNCPEFQTHFDDIWKLSFQRRKEGADKKIKTISDEKPALSFLDSGEIAQIAGVVIPFLSGVFSSILANVAYDRLIRNRDQTEEIVKNEAKKIREDLGLSPREQELIGTLIQYAIRGIMHVGKKGKVEKPYSHLTDLLDERLEGIYKQVLEDQELKELLIHIENAHPNFTSHGPDHSKSVIMNFEKIVPKKKWIIFSSLEILVFLCAAWFHDVGMSDFEGKLPECSSEEERKELRRFIRDNHADRSEKYVIDQSNYRRLHLEYALAEIIGVVCKAHVNEYDIMNIRARWGPMQGYEQYGEIRVRLIAALLRLADALDLGYRRVKEALITVYNIPKNYVESIPHIKGALLISGVFPRERTIVIQATPSNKEQEKWVEFLRSMLEEDFLSVRKILKDKKENGIELPYSRVIVETLENSLSKLDK
jgi:hypothetical protein